ncbi:DUF4328 domain-containing protein [Streptomyces sp. NPDC023998]|uniref:DUF4328 domain-containing protein n=1 Tax=Streptomyces sp. NPDC023998 TaxID=3154597 RepID=UPI0034072B8B
MGTAYSVTDLEQTLSVTDAVGIVQGVAQFATAVVFIIWFHRVRANADVFAPDLQRRGRGWAIGGWFVPIGNFYLPRAIAADIWAASRQDPYGRGKQEPHTIVNVWWIAWLVANLVNGIAGSQYDRHRRPTSSSRALTPSSSAALPTSAPRCWPSSSCKGSRVCSSSRRCGKRNRPQYEARLAHLAVLEILTDPQRSRLSRPSHADRRMSSYRAVPRRRRYRRGPDRSSGGSHKPPTAAAVDRRQVALLVAPLVASPVAPLVALLVALLVASAGSAVVAGEGL